MSRVIDAGRGLAEMGRLDQEAYARLRATLINNGDYIDGDPRLADTLHRTLDEFDEGFVAYCQQANVVRKDSDAWPPIIVGRDGLQRDVEHDGRLTIVCDRPETVLGDEIDVARAVGATVVGSQYDIRFNADGSLQDDALPRDHVHISLGVMHQEEYYPIATMLNHDAHPNHHVLSASRPAGILAVANVVNVAPRQYSPISL